MKKFTMILALVAILGMAGTTFADVNISVSDPVASVLVPGYDIYTLSVVNDEAYLGFIAVDGVVQANKFEQWGPPTYDETWQITPTVFSPFGPANPMEVDTHLLFAKTDGVYVGQESETNDETLSAAGAIMGWTLGVGSFDMGGGTGFSPALAAGTDFMQVVLPAGGGPVIVSGYIAGTPDDILWSQSVGVPEPSTILMLVVGGLCFLAVRFRK